MTGRRQCEGSAASRGAGPRHDVDSALRLEPLPEEQPDGVVERDDPNPPRCTAEPPTLCQGSDRGQVGREGRRGLLRLDPAQRVVDGPGVRAVGVDEAWA